MRNFILLLRRFWNLILFVFLLFVSIYLIAKNKKMQGLTIISSSNKIVGYLYKKQSDIIQYFQLKQLNDELIADHSYLLQRISNYEATDSFQNVLAQLPDTILSEKPQEFDTLYDKTEAGEDTIILKPITTEKIVITYTDYEFVPVRVIKNSITQSHINFITLNRGKSSGIKVGMPVVLTNGIVGRVAQVSENFATVASVLSNRKIHARIENDLPGFLYWDGKDPAYVRMDDLSLIDSISIGEKVYTTEDSYFPANIEIGEVAQVEMIERTNSKSISIKLNTNFRNLKYAYVVIDSKVEEKEKLEEKTEKN